MTGMSLSHTRAGHERGAVLVEAALVTPLVFLLLFGVIEFGYAFYGKLTVDNMSVVGARAASGSGNDVLADYQVLQSVAGANTGISNSDVQLVIVYRATSPSDRVPTSCLTASVTNFYSPSVRGCNRYVGSDLARPSTDFGCDGPLGPDTLIDQLLVPDGSEVHPHRHDGATRLHRRVREGQPSESDRPVGIERHVHHRHGDAHRAEAMT